MAKLTKEKLIANSKKTLLILAIMFSGAIWFEDNYRILWNKQWDLAYSCDSYRFALASLEAPEKITKGDIVFFKNDDLQDILDPKVWREYKIYKQVMAVGGDHVKVVGNEVYINGELVADRPLLERLTKLNKPHYTKDFEITLAEDELFMFGFNLDKSFDSRYWGPIKKDAVFGEVLYRMFEA